MARCLGWLEQAHFTAEQLEILGRHEMLGPALGPELKDKLRDWRFAGEIWAPREGTPLLAGRAVDSAGHDLEKNGVRPAAYCPYLVVETDLLSAKLVETPLLSIINAMTMVASKASQVVAAAGDRPVFEFGQRQQSEILADGDVGLPDRADVVEVHRPAPLTI